MSLSREIINIFEGITVYEDARNKWENMRTNSPYFKKWFRNSKVVDEKGVPIVAYHGTLGNFKKFDKSLNVSDFGIHFGNPKQAYKVLLNKKDFF